MSLRLVQLSTPNGRRIAKVEQDWLQLLDDCNSLYELANSAFDAGTPLPDYVASHLSADRLDYTEIYEGRSETRVLPSADHQSPWRTLVSGTGLTHTASVQRRNAMHSNENANEPAAHETDSMRMFRWGVEGGKPAGEEIGVPPEWFYKGNGTVLRGHGDPMVIPSFAESGGEEPEIAGVYLIDGKGHPRRLGLTIGNEFSDHKFEKKNYLYLAHSKLRTCAIGPELVVNPKFSNVSGQVKVERNGEVIWSSSIQSGEDVMSHSLANLEHHHFKYDQHRQPGDLHVHFFGADAFSFGSGVELQEGDVTHVEFQGFGRPLRNPVHVETKKISRLTVHSA